MPAISVIIATYNYGHFIGESLESVFAQDFRDYELLLVDDGSTDDTAEIARQWQERFGDRLKYFKRPHAGVYAARNFALSQAHGRYISFLDADDQWMPDALSTLYSYLENHPESAAVYANAEIFDHATRKPMGRHFPDLHKFPFTGKCTDKLFLRGNFVPFMAVLVRKDAIPAEPFDPKLKVGGDYEFWLELSCRHRLAHIDKIIVRVRRHGKNLTSMTMAQAKTQFKILRRFRRRARPMVSSWKPSDLARRWRRIYYQIGLAYFLANDSRRARRWFARAVCIHPFDISDMSFFYRLASYFIKSETILGLREKWHRLRHR